MSSLLIAEAANRGRMTPEDLREWADALYDEGDSKTAYGLRVAARFAKRPKRVVRDGKVWWAWRSVPITRVDVTRRATLAPKMWRRGKDAHWHVGTWALPYMRLAGARHEEVQKTCPKVTHNGDWHSAIAQAEAILAKVTGMVMYRTRAEAYLAYARAVGETTKQDIEGEG